MKQLIVATMKQLLARSLQTIFVCAFCILFSIRISAQAGALDSSFGDKGKVLTDMDGKSDQANSVAMQKDGKIIVVGFSFDESFNGAGFLVCRYQTNGNLDSSFGINGKVTTPFSGIRDFSYSIVIQHDEKIVVSGSSYGNIALVRYDPNGNIDSSFGENGKSLTSVSGGGDNIIIDLDGKFLVSANQFGLARFTPAGKLDSSFGINGLTGVQFNAASVNSASHALQPDGKIIEVGLMGNDYMHYNYAIARFESNGKIDSTFGENGLVVTTFEDWASYATSVGVLPDSKILVTGGVANYSAQTASFSLARYKQNGSLDSSFGINGKLINESLHLALAFSLILSDDKILLAGQSYVGSMSYFGLVRLRADGVPDSTFGVNGETYTNFQDGYSIGFDGALQADKKIVIVGRVTIGTKDDFALARYNNDVSLPVSLLSFAATQKDKSVLLSWQTAEEINSNYFVVERASNTRWEELAYVNSRANSSQIQSYSYEDFHPLRGQNFYRLKQVDRDGKFTYSKIVYVDFENGIAILVYPNPVNNILNVDGLNSSAINNLSIVDINGKLIAAANTKDAHYAWNVQSLSKGVYYLRVEANGKKTTMKFVKH